MIIYTALLTSVVVHILISFGHISIALILLYAVFMVTLRLVISPTMKVFLVLATLTGAAVGGALMLNTPNTAMYFPSVVIPLFFFGVFSLSLLPGRMPLASQVAILRHGSLSPKLKRYTRNLTITWSVILIAISLEALLLAAFAPLEVWSLFANVLNYAFVISFLFGEYVFRTYRFSELEFPGFMQFLRSLPQVTHGKQGK